MQVKLVPDCLIGLSRVTNRPILADVYLIIDESQRPLWQENLFLIDISQEYGANTLKAIANDLLSFARATIALGGWSKVKKRDMTGYIAGDLIQTRSFTEASTQRHIASIRKFYTWLEKKGYSAGPDQFNWNYKSYYAKKEASHKAPTPDFSDLHSTYIDKKSYKKLLSFAERDDAFLAARDRICIRLGYEAGTRAAETLKINQLSISNAVISARDKNNGLWATTRFTIIGKGNKLRELLIPPSLCEEIYRYCTRFSDYFSSKHAPLICKRDGGNIKNTKHASYAFTALSKAAELTRIGHQGYHSLRKSFATNLVSECHQNGTDPWVEVPRRMGHENVETTKKYIYFEALLNNRSKILAQLRMNSYRGIRVEKT